MIRIEPESVEEAERYCEALLVVELLTEELAAALEVIGERHEDERASS